MGANNLIIWTETKNREYKLFYYINFSLENFGDPDNMQFKNVILKVPTVRLQVIVMQAVDIKLDILVVVWLRNYK